MVSQYGIEKYLGSKGYFLEIGAWHGEMISQTAFIERLGWNGLCVDPFPVGFENRNCLVCPKAISKDGKPRQFIKVSIDRRYGGDVSYFSGLKDSVKEYWPLIKEHCDYKELTLETITMDELYKWYNIPDHVDFLSVDTEGSELEIFESIDFKKYSYGLIVFEHNKNEQVKKAIGEILLSNGYKLHDELEIDSIYINNNLW